MKDNRKGEPASFFSKPSRRGISSLHGAHQAAQKFSHVHLPEPTCTDSGRAGAVLAAARDRCCFGKERPASASLPAHSERGFLGAAGCDTAAGTVAGTLAGGAPFCSMAWLRSFVAMGASLLGTVSHAMSATPRNAKPNATLKLTVGNRPMTRTRSG